MVSVQISAPGLSDPMKMMNLTHELALYEGLLYQFHPTSETVDLRFEGTVPPKDEILYFFTQAGLDPQFIGEVPSEICDLDISIE